MVRDPTAEPGQLPRRLVVQDRGPPPLGRHQGLRRARGGADGLHGLVRDLTVGHGQLRTRQGQLVGVHQPADDGLAESPGRADQHRVAAPSARVGGEHDPGRLRVDELLDHHGQTHLGRVDVLPSPVRHRPGGPQGRPAPADGVQHRVRAADVQIGVLLARETGTDQVLGGRRRAHGHGSTAQLAIGPGDGGGQVTRHLPGREQVGDRAGR